MFLTLFTWICLDTLTFWIKRGIRTFLQYLERKKKKKRKKKHSNSSHQVPIVSRLYFPLSFILQIERGSSRTMIKSAGQQLKKDVQHITWWGTIRIVQSWEWVRNMWSLLDLSPSCLSRKGVVKISRDNADGDFNWKLAPSRLFARQFNSLNSLFTQEFRTWDLVRINSIFLPPTKSPSSAFRSRLFLNHENVWMVTWGV